MTEFRVSFPDLLTGELRTKDYATLSEAIDYADKRREATERHCSRRMADTISVVEIA